MFRRKTIYIILLTVFSLIMCAELAICLIVPSWTPPSGFSSRQTDGSDFSGDVREDRMASGKSTFGMPSEEAASGEMRENEDMSEFIPGESSGGQFTPSASGGLLYTLKGLWLPIILVCVLIDAFSVFMLIRISRKRGKGSKEKVKEQSSGQQPQKPVDMRAKKRKKRRALWITALAVVAVFVAVISILPALMTNNGGYANVEEKVISASAETGSLTTSLKGCGSLSEDSAISVTLPGDIEIESYAVKNGDIVKKGDLIARVDKASVMLAIADLQEAMDKLDAELEQSASETIETVIKMPSDGRIKAIYAENGAEVADTMYEHSALMLISLDGLMAVDIEAEGLSVGESVSVALSDGDELTGRVSKLSDTTATVTLTDDGPKYGDTVTVSDESGQSLGSGILYINSELKITGYAGKISKVHVSLEQEVSAGKKLITLEEADYTATYSGLYNERLELEERMHELFKAYQSGCVYAECAGAVSGISEDAEYAAEEGGVSALSASAPGQAVKETLVMTLASAGGISGINTSSDGSIALLANNPTGMDETGLVNYAAKVTAIAYGSISVNVSPAPVVIADYSDLSGVDTTALTNATQVTPGSTVPVYIYENGAWQTGTAAGIQTGDLVVFTYDAMDSLIWIVYAHTSDTGQIGGGSQPGGGGSQPGGQGGIPGGGMLPGGGSYAGGAAYPSYDFGEYMGGSTGSAAGEAEEQEAYELTETAICDIIPGDIMTVSISVDELDILCVSTGQTAAITLDALPGQSFEGEITEIDRTGENDGGNTKYAVTLTLPRTEDMLSGMNASVIIDLSEKSGLTLIPEAAIYEKGNDTFVYTGYDERKDELTDPVPVTTGMSDGVNAEITSGLSPGDEYCYRYADTITYSFGS